MEFFLFIVGIIVIILNSIAFANKDKIPKYTSYVMIIISIVIIDWCIIEYQYYSQPRRASDVEIILGETIENYHTNNTEYNDQNVGIGGNDENIASAKEQRRNKPYGIKGVTWQIINNRKIYIIILVIIYITSAVMMKKSEDIETEIGHTSHRSKIQQVAILLIGLFGTLLYGLSGQMIGTEIYKMINEFRNQPITIDQVVGNKDEGGKDYITNENTHYNIPTVEPPVKIEDKEVIYVTDQYIHLSPYIEGEYTGEMVDGKPNGYGKLKYCNDDEYYYKIIMGSDKTEYKALSYEGSFKNGWRDGVGKVTYEGGYRDEGTFYGSWLENKKVFEGKRWYKNEKYIDVTVIATSSRESKNIFSKGGWKRVK